MITQIHMPILFVDYNAEGALLLFKILYLELVHKEFPFMLCGSEGLGSLAIPGKSEVNQKPRSCKQHKKGLLVRA